MVTALTRGLLGRRSECETLDRLVATVRAGQSAVLVVRGEPGVGKSSLLGCLVERASGCRIARASGVESEMELPYAGLHQLCGPMLDRLDRLPAPQRDALATAFGLSAGDPPDRFLVGLAVLSLLSEVAEDGPLVCVVDDAHWQDRASAQILAFVARRLLAEAVGLVFAVREPSPTQDLAGLPELVVGGLDEGDASAVLHSAIPGRLDERVRDRIIAEARGNTLALLELPRGLTSAELAGGGGGAGGAGGGVRPADGRAAGEPDRAELRPASRAIARRDAPPPAGGGGRTARRRHLVVARGRATRTRDRRGRPRPGRGPHRARCPGAVPSSVAAFGGIPGGLRVRAPGHPSGAGRGHRSGDRSRPPRLASGASGVRARRGRGRRAGALGRPGARPRGC